MHINEGKGQLALFYTANNENEEEEEEEEGKQ